jgi:hypothetical protein
VAALGDEHLLGEVAFAAHAVAAEARPTEGQATRCADAAVGVREASEVASTYRSRPTRSVERRRAHPHPSHVARRGRQARRRRLASAYRRDSAGAERLRFRLR